MDQVIVFGTGVVAYGVIDECARAGLRIIHLTTKRDDIAAQSSHIDERAYVEFVAVSEADILGHFLASADRWKGSLLLPVNDRQVVFVSRHIEALSEHFRCGFPPWTAWSRYSSFRDRFRPFNSARGNLRWWRPTARRPW